MNFHKCHIAALCLLLFCADAFAADLTPAQQKLLKEAQTYMAQVQTNLQDARATSGGNPSPAKAQLAFTRIDSTKTSINQVKARLVELPATHPDVQSLQTQIDSALKDLEDIEAHLTGKKPEKSRESIITANELPPDRYKGTDRDQLGKIASSAWLKIQPDAKVLAIRIPSEYWEKEVLPPSQPEPATTNRSKLQVQLVVRHDDKLAVIHPVNLWKNHLEADAVTASPLHEKATDLSPQDFLLLSKVK